MPQFTLNDLANNAGQATANAGINLAKQAKGLACGLYKNYTGFATTFGLGTAPPAAFVKGVWDTVCADDPGGLPPTSAPPFTGGQCVCTLYKVNCNWRIIGYENTPQGTYFNGFGPIGGIRIVEDTPQGDTIQVYARRSLNGTCQPDSVWHDVYATGAGTGAKLSQAQIVEITTLSGAADTCGNSPPMPPPYVAPPPSAINKNVTINYNDGTDFNVPLTYVQMNNDLDIIVDVGGVAFNFNVDKVSFDWNFGPSGAPNAPPGGGGNGGGNGGGSSSNSSNINLNAKLDNITNKIDNTLDVKLDDVIIDVDLIKDKVGSPSDCCPEPPDLDTQTATVCPIDDGNTYSGIEGLVSVKLDVTKLPLSSKIQFANGSPNVLFAGWLAFTHDGQAYEREPIHFQHNLFTAPKGSNGFFYCLTNGAKGRVTYYVKT